MNGHFERDNTAYPIGYLRIGEGYRVTDMRNLHPLHLHGIPVADAKTIASKANLKLQARELPLAPDAQEVLDFVQAEVAAL